ncbi:MAG: transporter substrate-binding domain-containing protein, partial [Acetobacteraceae bacterium]
MTDTPGFRRRFLAPAAGGLAALGAFAFGRPAAAQGADARAALAATSMIEEVKRRGTLRVGMSTFIPWAFRNRAGELVGYEIDVANRLAQDMSVRAEFVPTAWDGIIPALLAGRFDAVIGGMTITPARNLTANFTSAYSATGVEIAASRRLDQGMTTFEAWYRPNITITGRRGPSGLVAARRLFPSA